MSEGLVRDTCGTGKSKPMNNLLSVVDIYKLNANVIVSIDHLFTPPARAWCFGLFCILSAL